MEGSVGLGAHGAVGHEGREAPVVALVEEHDAVRRQVVERMAQACGARRLGGGREDGGRHEQEQGQQKDEPRPHIGHGYCHLVGNVCPKARIRI